MKSSIHGVFPALITPFENDKVDEHALRKLVAYQLESGVSGLVPCGTTGESATLSAAEHREVIRIVIDENKGRVPVFAGTGSVSTKKAIEFSKTAKEVGADGLLLVCPYYNRPTQAGIEAHFREVLNAVPMPTMLYNVPARTGVDLAPETVAKLLDISDIIAMKEASGKVARTQELCRRFGDRLVVMSGDDPLVVPMMACGAKGVVSVTSNYAPKEVSQVVALWLEGRIGEALKLHQRLLPVHEAMFIEANPGPVKQAMADAGRIQPEIRLPMVMPGKTSMTLVHEALRTAKLS